MSAKHTPGPWEVYETDDAFHSSAEVGVCCANGERDVAYTLNGNNRDAARANARLIAAAPELLEHLKIAMEYLPHVSLEWAKKARATITKAEGRQ